MPKWPLEGADFSNDLKGPILNLNLILSLFQQKPKDRRLMRGSRGRASFSASGALEKRDVSF